MLGLLGGLSLVAGAAHSETAAQYPSRPIKLIIPFAPGGSGDVIAHALQASMQQILGQPLVTENKGGAGAILGTQDLTQAAPDGYTLELVNPLLVTNPAMTPNLPYKTPEDFTPVGSILTFSLFLATRKDFPATNVADFISYVKANPGKVTLATSGPGSTSQLSQALLSSLTGMKIVEIPYKGGGPIALALAGSQVDYTFATPSVLDPLIQANNVNILGTTSPTASTDPAAPSMSATPGLENYSYVAWYGMVAPAGTPADIVAKLNDALNQSLQKPEVVQALASLNGTIKTGSPKDFSDWVNSELAKWSKVIKDAGITVQ
ncbi:MAG TPA: tripartite tricarboxylate transporter substrate-binding protein [Bauldia sp.]|nr:tripartite tricarboxylate transporter substrate-binding protein [Bauldia sp.]